MPKRAVPPGEPPDPPAVMPKRAVPAAEAAKTPSRSRRTTAATSKTRTRASAKVAADQDRRQTEVVINGRGGTPMTIPFGPELQRAALEWSRIVRNRLRWAAQSEARDDQALHSRTLLGSLGLNLALIDQLAEDPVVQVTIPFVTEDVGWEARIFPWEYILSAAMRGASSKSLIVVRHLERMGAGNGREQAVKPTPDPALILESAPGILRARFRFESERQLVASSLRNVEVEVLADASPSQAREHIVEKAPGAIHLSGVDTHQGAQILGLDDRPRDGFLMVDSRGRPLPVPAEELAGLLTGAAVAPRLVACNFQNSAARVAAMIVAFGAEAAIGFQDVVDDSFAELMFASFYANWDGLKWDTFAAFEKTFLDLQGRPDHLSGTGIVLWSAHDVFASSPAASAPAPAPVVEVVSRSAEGVAASGDGSGAGPGEAGPPPAAGGPIPDAAFDGAGGAGPGPVPPIGTSTPPILTPGVVSVVVPPPDIWIEPRVNPRVNYSLLHNDRSLFDSFRIRKSTSEIIPDVQVEVILYAGGDSFPYRMSLPLSDPITDLRDRIRVPLTSSLLRGVRESVQSVVYVRVMRGQVILYQDTFPVSLIPIEEWVNNDDDAIWLPSFVLPRDPVVDQIVQRALGMLRALDDNGKVGFMGYQVVDEGRDDPYDRVDLQVQAIWSTLSFQYDIAYINPPPTYSPHAQRLRTPSEVIRSQSGTCIDLALLFAACLESIDIYSVIVLYDGHANAGYWRGDRLHQAFEIVQPPDASAAGAANAGGPGQPAPGDGGAAAGAGAAAAGGGAAGQGEGGTRETPVVPWQLRRQAGPSDPTLHELRTRVERNELFIVDATRLTTHDGFGVARDKGKASLDSRLADGRVFQSLIDIQIARRNGITPLPIEPR